jgi:hypothetical protein
MGILGGSFFTTRITIVPIATVPNYCRIHDFIDCLNRTITSVKKLFEILNEIPLDTIPRITAKFF